MFKLLLNFYLWTLLKIWTICDLLDEWKFCLQICIWCLSEDQHHSCSPKIQTLLLPPSSEWHKSHPVEPLPSSKTFQFPIQTISLFSITPNLPNFGYNRICGSLHDLLLLLPVQNQTPAKCRLSNFTQIILEQKSGGQIFVCFSSHLYLVEQFCQDW